MIDEARLQITEAVMTRTIMETPVKLSKMMKKVKKMESKTKTKRETRRMIRKVRMG
jgi:hypothetical protein